MFEPAKHTDTFPLKKNKKRKKKKEKNCEKKNSPTSRGILYTKP
jgi:hypothetical protein